MGVTHQQALSRLAIGLLCAVALSACGSKSVTPVKHKSDPAAVDSAVLQSLQRQIIEQEKRIAELESQLDTLKVIDQDVAKRRRPSRPPATLTPIE
ncbi:MAG: hypothetical protein ACT4OL_07750 [Nitrospiraceae bacterium]